MKGALPSFMFAWPCLNKDTNGLYFAKALGRAGHLPMAINGTFIQQIFTQLLSGLKTPQSLIRGEEGEAKAKGGLAHSVHSSDSFGYMEIGSLRSLTQ